MNTRSLFVQSLVLLLPFLFPCLGKEANKKHDPWVGWHRPVDANAFVTTKGNNHDSVLFVEPELEYPYHLIIS